MFFEDLDGNPVENFPMSATLNEVKTFQQQIECHNTYKLSCDAIVGPAVEAKHHSSGVYVNIETTPISLDPWDGTVQVFDFRITAPAVEEQDTIILRVQP